jgi:hypothetical protein
MHGSTNVNFPMIIVCTLATALCWGTYGPLLQWGHGAMGSGRLRPFICVGIAYLIIAIVGPILVMTLTGMENENGLFGGWIGKDRGSGIFWSLMGGSVGALGALGVILALNYGGQPGYVMPVVFGCAPIVNTAFTMYFSGAWQNMAGWRGSLYFAGLILVAVGAVVVLTFAPKAPPRPSPTAKPPAVSKDLTAAKQPAPPTDSNKS